MFKLGKIALLAMFLIVSPAQADNLLLLGEGDIAEAVKKEFVEQGLEDKIELEFFGGQTSFALENVKAAKVMISKLKFDATQNKFSATAEIFADGNPYAKTSLSGRYYVMGENAGFRR